MKASAILLILLSTVFFSCTKEKGPETNDWTCGCRYKWGGKDSTVNFKYPGTTREQIKAACDQKETYYQSLSGTGGASCTFF